MRKALAERLAHRESPAPPPLPAFPGVAFIEAAAVKLRRRRMSDFDTLGCLATLTNNYLGNNVGNARIYGVQNTSTVPHYCRSTRKRMPFRLRNMPTAPGFASKGLQGSRTG
jgi:hypothetical protein